MKKSTSAALLSYSIRTEPSPVNISSANKPATAKIIITIAKNTTILCKDITVQIPIGNNATDLYQVSPAPTDSILWKPWETAANPNSNPLNTKICYYKNTSEDKTVSSEIKITLEGTVNFTSGMATILVIENSTTKTDNKYMKRQQSISITKSGEEAFFLNNVVASSLSAVGHPKAEFTKNEKFQITWQSNGDSFKVYSSTNLKPASQTTKFYKLDSGLLSDTTFIIEATKAGKFLYQEYHVKIKESNESFNQIKIAEVIELSTKATTKLTNDILTTNTVKKLSNDILSKETIKKLSDDILSKEAVDKLSDNILSRPIQILGSDGFKYIDDLDFKADTDGYLIVEIFMSASNWNVGVVELVLPDITIPHTIISKPGQDTRSSVSVPLKKGTTFYITGYGEGSIWVKRYWISMGAGRSRSTSKRSTRNAPAKPLEIKANKHLKGIQKQKAEDLVSALEEAFDKKLSKKVRKNLIEKFM